MTCQLTSGCSAPAVTIIVPTPGDHVAACASCAPHHKEQTMIQTTIPTLAEQFRDFITGAAEAALWSTTPLDNDGMGDTPADELEIGGDERTKLRGTIAHHSRDWFVTYYPLIRRAMSGNPEYNDWGQVGHDWWLTTQGHGAGFWDRGLGTAGAALTASCEGYEGILDLYLDDAGALRVDAYNVLRYDESLDDARPLAPTIGALHHAEIAELRLAWRTHIAQLQHEPVKGQLAHWTARRETELAELLLLAAPEARDLVMSRRLGRPNVDMSVTYGDEDAPDVEFIRVTRSEWVGRDHDRGEDYFTEDTEVVRCTFEELADEMDETVGELIVNIDALAVRPARM